MTQQETKAVEDAAFEYFQTLPGYHQGKTVDISWVNAYVTGAEKLAELRKPSEPETNVGEAGKGLVSEIDAALMQPDKELLEALKKICRVAPSYIKNPDDELDNAICDAMLAVYNYEKQGK